MRQLGGFNGDLFAHVVGLSNLDLRRSLSERVIDLVSSSVGSRPRFNYEQSSLRYNGLGDRHNGASVIDALPLESYFCQTNVT